MPRSTIDRVNELGRELQGIGDMMTEVGQELDCCELGSKDKAIGVLLLTYARLFDYLQDNLEVAASSQ